MCEPGISVENVLIHTADAEIFHWINEKSGPRVALPTFAVIHQAVIVTFQRKSQKFQPVKKSPRAIVISWYL